MITFRQRVANRMRDDQGAVAIEFALISALVLALLAVGLDFGVYILDYANLSAAVEQAAMIAFQQGRTSAINTTALASYVTGTANLPTTGTQAATITITCNGSISACAAAPASRVYDCLSSNPSTFAVAAGQGSTCPDGSNAGFYVTVAASYPYSWTIVPNAWLNTMNISQSVTVRVQ
jgi:Flp pilus assembly protein TadG